MKGREGWKRRSKGLKGKGKGKGKKNVERARESERQRERGRTEAVPGAPLLGPVAVVPARREKWSSSPLVLFGPVRARVPGRTGQQTNHRARLYAPPGTRRESRLLARAALVPLWHSPARLSTPPANDNAGLAPLQFHALLALNHYAAYHLPAHMC